MFANEGLIELLFNFIAGSTRNWQEAWTGSQNTFKFYSFPIKKNVNKGEGIKLQVKTLDIISIGSNCQVFSIISIVFLKYVNQIKIAD